jgi:hypothetical protein
VVVEVRLVMGTVERVTTMMTVCDDDDEGVDEVGEKKNKDGTKGVGVVVGDRIYHD